MNISAIIGAAGALFVAFLLHTVDVDRLESNQRSELANQEKLLAGRCHDDKAITKESNDDVSSAFIAINNRLRSDLMQSTTPVILPATYPTNIPASGGKPSRPVRINIKRLREYGATCEEYRQERLIHDKFIDKTWKANGQ